MLAVVLMLVGNTCSRRKSCEGTPLAPCYQKVAGSIPLVCMSKRPWARYWTPNCSWCAGRHLAWQPSVYVWITVSRFGQKLQLNSLNVNISGCCCPYWRNPDIHWLIHTCSDDTALSSLVKLPTRCHKCNNSSACQDGNMSLLRTDWAEYGLLGSGSSLVSTSTSVMWCYEC